MGRLVDNCEKLAHALEVNTANGSLPRKLKTLKKSRALGTSIMEHALTCLNPASMALRTSSWFVHKIQTVFDQ
jgi:hypothetical protein